MYLDKNGKKWFKGNLHTHTTVSDGRLPPEDAAALYRKNGYDFLAVTDHWKYAEAKTTEDGMLLLSGAEYNVNGNDILKGVFHIVGVGMTEEPRLDRNDPAVTAQTLIDGIHACGGLAVYAHPCWSMNTPDQLLPLRDIDAVEIYNSVSGLPHNCRPYSGDIIDLCAARGRFFLCTAADDTHFYENDACFSCIWVQADALSRDAILDAVRAGRVIATQKPLFTYTVTENGDGSKTVHFDLTQPDGHAPVVSVIFYTGSVWNGNRSVNGENITEAAFTLRAEDRFVRMECMDADGLRGFASPIPF